MKTKQFTAIVLALLAATALLAGCEATLHINEPETTLLNQDALRDALGDEELDGDKWRELQSKGLIPEEVTMPTTANTQPTTVATTMPKGVEVRPSEVYPLVKGVKDIFNSGTFYLKGRNSSPMDVMGMGGGTSSTMVLAMDQDKAMVESEMDWIGMMKASVEPGNAALAAIQGATMQTYLGNKFRMVFNPEGAYFVFPEKKRYIDFSDAQKTDQSGEVDMSEIASELAHSLGGVGGNLETPVDVPASRVTVDGKEYLCGTLTEAESGTSRRFCFLDGQLKRIEVLSATGDVSMVMEIDEFSGSADASLFSMSGYRSMPVAELTNLLSGALGSMEKLFG
jgi:hypothetical protein